MHTPFVVAVAGLLLSVCRPCSATTSSSKSRSSKTTSSSTTSQFTLTACLTTGHEDYGPTTTVSAFSKLRACSTGLAFCKSVQTGAPPGTYTSTIYHVTATAGNPAHPTTFKHYKYINNHKTTITKPAPTVIKGKKTTTIGECNTFATCGTATFKNINSDVSYACECLQYTAVEYTTIDVEDVYATTKTVTITQPTGYTLTKTTVLPTTTVSVATATATTCITVPPPKQMCHNRGIEWAYYAMKPQDDASDPGSLSGWDPTIYKSRTPMFNGSADLIGYDVYNLYQYDSSYDNDRVYGHTVPDANFTVASRGYIYAPQNGTYYFNVPTVNEIAYFWLGDVAYSGWKISNALFVAHSQGYGENPVGQVRLVAGNYYPFRFAYAIGDHGRQVSACPNYADCGFFFYHFNRPDGTFFAGFEDPRIYPKFEPDPEYDGYGDPIISPYIVRFGCNDKSAPKFQPWGQET